MASPTRDATRVTGRSLGLGRRALTVAWRLITATGVLHLAVALVSYDRLTPDALWFAGNGLAVMLIGVITLHARVPPGVATRRAAVGANAAELVLATGFAILTTGREPQGPLLMALFVLAAAAARR